MTSSAPRSFGARLRALRESAGFTQEELATIAGLSVHGISALERGERRRPHVETVRALSAALDLTGAVRDAFVASARASVDTTAVDELSVSAFPLALTPLLGRDGDVATLREWLANPSVRLITLTGPGGVGKTRLALEIAQVISAESTTRVIFVTLAAIRDPAFVAPAIAEALGLSNTTSHELPQRARVACADRSTLIVLDNFEQVLEAAPLVAELLSSGASLRAVVTSRAPLRVRGEREYAVGPLALAVDSDAMSPPELARCAAVRLFVDRVRDVQPDFCLTTANGSAVAAICRRLDALPLALELAAPWMKVLTVEDLVHRLDRDVLLSPIGPRDLPERQQTMNATVAWSYQLLDPGERTAFRRLGALPGRFPMEAAAAVLADGEGSPAGDEAVRAIAGLIDKSLLLRAEAAVAARPLYQMLETVRAYAAFELNAAGERDAAMEGLVRYCTGEASLVAGGTIGPAQVEWLDRAHDDLENYRGALTWLMARGRSAEAVHIAWSLMWFWMIRGHAAEGLRWYEPALSLPSLPHESAMRTLIGASVMWYAQGQPERARTSLTRVLAEAADDAEMVAQAEYMLGRVELAARNMDAARNWFTRSHERFRALGLLWGSGLSLNANAWICLAAGETDQAERLLDDAMSDFSHAGPWFLSASQNLRAIIAVRRGAPDEALAWVRQSLGHIRDLHDKFSFVYAMVPLAAAAVLKGNDAWAARILGARDAVSESTGTKGEDVDALREQLERTARGRLGADQWALAYAAGRLTSIDSLLQEIEEVV